MKVANLISLVALVLFAPLSRAHEVPDRVNIGMFVNQEQDKLVVLVRVPANALIDTLLPTLDESGSVDLRNAGELATEGANTWIADQLRFSDGDRALPRALLVALRISRLNDPAFRNYDDAYSRIKGPPLSFETLARQDELTVDAMLEIPTTSPTAQLSFQPRFARLGVVVDMSLTFISIDGGARNFKYEGDPPPFELNPGFGQTLGNFLHSGWNHYFDETDYLLLALCIALVFQSTRGALSFAGLLVVSQAIVVLIALGFMSSPFWLRGLCGTAIAAAIVYAGCESIIAIESKRRALAILIGAIFGYGFWIGLQPIVQYGGAHSLASGVGFVVGALGGEIVALLVAAIVVRTVFWISRAPRRATIVIAAFAIHLGWRRFLDRADALALMPSELQGVESTAIMVIAAIMLFLFFATLIYRKWARPFP